MRSVSVCPETGLRRGAWTQEEDRLLSAYIERYGLWNWREIPKYAGLSRCGKSCRLRWMNYLRPDIKRGNFTPEEDEIITNSIQKFGQRWSAIAKNLPGRTDNEVKNHWHTSLKKQSKISAALEPKRVKRDKSRRVPLALNNPVLPGSRNSYILESSAVVTLQQEKSSDSSVSTSDSESVSTENEATKDEISSEGDTVFPEELFSKPISPEDAHVWDDNSSVWIDSLITDPFSLIEEALYGYELYNHHSMGSVFNQ